MSKEQEKDFDKFTALGLNFQQRLRDAASIIQNPDHNITDEEAINAWATIAEQGLEELVITAKSHIRHVARSLRNQDYGREPLGYFHNGRPIYSMAPGMLATACILRCSSCPKVIRGMGGPARGAKCLDCYKEGK